MKIVDIRLFLLFFTLQLFVLSGCLPKLEESRQTLSPTSADIDDSLKVIRFFTTESDPNQINVLRELIEEYQRTNPHIEIDIVLASPASRGRRLLTSLASGSDLGIFEIEPVFMTEWAEAGYLLDLHDVVASIGIDEFLDGSLYRHQDNIYAVPYAASVYGLWVRTDLFEEVGLPIPTTYDDVLEAAQTLTNGSTYGIALPAGQNIATVNYFSTFLWQNGGDYFTCDGGVVFDSPEALQAIYAWKQLTEYAPPGYTTWGFGEQIDAFISGRVAMTMYAGRLGVNVADNAPELLDKITVIFPPWGQTPVTLGVWSRYAIAASTKYQQEAKDFLGWLLKGEHLLRYDMTVPGHMIPPLKSLQDELLTYDLPYVRQHRDWIEQFMLWLPTTSHPSMNMGVIQNDQFVLSDQVPPWSEDIFGSTGIIVRMLQNISLNDQDIEVAWQKAVEQMKTTVNRYKEHNPNWQTTNCS